MASVGDIIFCLTTSSTEPSYWVFKEVSVVDPLGRITHVQSVGIPETRCSISLFVEHKSPQCQDDFVKNMARHFQKSYAGRIDGEIREPYGVDDLIEMIDWRIRNHLTKEN